MNAGIDPRFDPPELCLLPEQMRTDATSPEIRLAWAVLLQGLADADHPTLSRNINKLQTEASAWVASDAVHYGSFVWVCEMLGLDPAWTRSKRRPVAFRARMSRILA